MVARWGRGEFHSSPPSACTGAAHRGRARRLVVFWGLEREPQRRGDPDPGQARRGHQVRTRLGLRNPTTHRFEGFDVAIAELMAVGMFGGTPDSLGDKIEFVETPFEKREAFIDNGTVDIVVASYAINEARKRVVDSRDRTW